MNVIATIQADLETTPLGTRSRLASELLGKPVLCRTVERVLSAKRVEAVYVCCVASQFERCQSLLAGTDAVVRSVDADPPPWASLVRTARKWSLDGWRGGLGGTSHFDEYTDTRVISGLLREVEADVALSISPAAALVDPALIDAMIDHHEGTGDDTSLTFTQAPPGLAGLVMDASLVHETAEQSTPVGWLLSYKPDTPQKDLIFQPCCHEIPAELRYAEGRLTADTDRSIERLTALLQDHRTPDLATIGRWLTQRASATAESSPREVEIELTTEDPYPETLLRPRGSRVPSRGPIDPAVVEQVVSELLEYDDALVVLAGFGDPLRHPEFSTILEKISAVRCGGRGLYGLAVRTSGVDLSDEVIEALIANRVDILEVTLDAWTAPLYDRLHSPNKPTGADLEAVLRRLDRVAELRGRHGSAHPVVVPEMTKAKDNVHELDEFHDGWIRRLGTVSLSGYSHHARQVDDRSVMSMAPATRSACRRIRSRCTVLADGRVVLCDQDVRGLHAVGRIGEQSLTQLWRGATFARVRQAHRQGRFDPTPLCAACDEWHRP